ncbi:MAG: NADH-quinone oxidoreductase subunit L, partial [Isosphaeraceae bacterium]
MADFLIRNAWLVPILPLVGALITALFARRLGERSALPVVVGIGTAFVVSIGLLLSAGPEAKTLVCPWIEAGGLKVPVEFRVDGLTTVMLSMVTFVSTLVAVFAMGYMAGDPGFARFFSVVGLFVTSMTG